MLLAAVRCIAACLYYICSLLSRVHAAGIALTIVFGGIAAVLMFTVLRHFGFLRVDQMTELAGIDNIEHGGPAYPEFGVHQLNGTSSRNGVR